MVLHPMAIQDRPAVLLIVGASKAVDAGTCLWECLRQCWGQYGGPYIRPEPKPKLVCSAERYIYVVATRSQRP